MKIPSLLTAAGLAASSLVALAPVPAVAQVSVTIGRPVGPGWYRWHERRVYAGGPAYYDVRGPHYGWYNWNNDYYQNCSWRWVGRHHRQREWRCW